MRSRFISRCGRETLEVAAALVLWAATPMGGWAAESSEAPGIELSRCPSAVQHFIQDKAGTNAIVRIERSGEQDDAEYDITLRRGGRECHFGVSAKGELLGSDDGGIELKDCPKAVKAAIQRLAGSAEVTTIEESGDSYEVELRDGERTSTLRIAGDGALESREDEIALTACPDAVRKTIEARAASRPVTAVVRTTENGETEYTVTTTRAETERQFTVGGDGEFREWTGEAVEQGDCPQAVQKAITQFAGKASVETIEDSVEEFTVDLLEGDRESTIVISADGKLQSREEDVTLDDCPDAVRKTIKEKAAGSEIGDVRRKTAGTVTTYFATLTKGDTERDGEIAQDGRFLGWDD